MQPLIALNLDFIIRLNHCMQYMITIYTNTHDSPIIKQYIMYQISYINRDKSTVTQRERDSSSWNDVFPFQDEHLFAYYIYHKLLYPPKSCFIIFLHRQNSFPENNLSLLGITNYFFFKFHDHTPKHMGICFPPFYIFTICR